MSKDRSLSFVLPFWETDGELRASPSDLRLSDPSDIAVGRDGDIYIADAGCHVVYWLRPGATDIYVVAGDGSDAVRTDAGPAGGLLRPGLGQPLSLALDRQDRLYIGTGHGLIRRLGTDNWIETLAGIGQSGYSGDGGPATEARFGPIDDLLATRGGMLYVDDTTANGRLRHIDVNGRVTTVAGTAQNAFTPDGLSPSGAAIGRIRGMTRDSRSRLYFAETATASPGLRRIASAYAGFPWQTELRVPVNGGTAVQVFDRSGRPQRTEDPDTGRILQTVAYDTQGRLAATSDENARSTRYERDGQGRISAIIAPNGQRTEVGYNDFAQPTTVTQPDGARWRMQYDARGMLTRYTDPNGNATRFAYDSLGRLVSDTDAAGGGWTVTHDLDAKAHEVQYTSGEGRVRRYRTDADPNTRVSTRVSQDSHGGRTVTVSDPIRRQSTRTAPDGTITVSESLHSAVPSGAAPDSRS
ncbi:MAG: hypothetical protein ABFS42_16705, partial [Candidatus Krumholzibacteriota bacterium]